MAKLRLTIEDLRVESFATALVEGRTGTVKAHAGYAPPATDEDAGYLQGTFIATQCDMSQCLDSCPPSCQITCGSCDSDDFCK